MLNGRFLILCWLGLVVLSFATVALASTGTTLLFSAAIMLMALCKAWLITDGFMELRHAPPFWRLLLLSWPAVMATGVLLSMNG